MKGVAESGRTTDRMRTDLQWNHRFIYMYVYISAQGKELKGNKEKEDVNKKTYN